MFIVINYSLKPNTSNLAHVLIQIFKGIIFIIYILIWTMKHYAFWCHFHDQSAKRLKSSVAVETNKKQLFIYMFDNVFDWIIFLACYSLLLVIGLYQTEVTKFSHPGENMCSHSRHLACSIDWQLLWLQYRCSTRREIPSPPRACSCTN